MLCLFSFLPLHRAAISMRGRTLAGYAVRDGDQYSNATVELRISSQENWINSVWDMRRSRL
jgi:hypothetical protein